MKPAEFARLKEILLGAAERSGAERQDYLDKHCPDPELLRSVEAMLAHDNGTSEVLGSENPPESDGTQIGGIRPPQLLRAMRENLAATTVEPEEVGTYKLLERIGEGGFGEVYVADQTAPVKRRVAVKILKAGMNTRAVLTRFEAERQALAMMNHPNIAKVLDAGETGLGQPYFVMELIRGEPMTTYCDHNRLSTRERLELFTAVCQAIQHAHQKGVIHRDVKPSNILVEQIDGEPIPKVIDFGIAKAIAGTFRLTDESLHTVRGQVIGTLAYMSPEQLEPSQLNVDTTTDVYSLGTVLYELLTGSLPFETKGLPESDPLAMYRLIREVDARRPSSKVQSLGELTTRVAFTRRTTPRNLVARLKGDLDWITMRALEKDRALRYGSAADLAADIGRHLRNEPVWAGPPGSGYRVRKFVRRHRTGIVAGGVVGLAMLLGVSGLIWGLVRARRSEARAVQAEASARNEAEAAEQVTDFLVGLFSVSNPNESGGNDVSARELLDRGAQRIGDSAELAEQPIVRARLLTALGYVYRSLGLLDQAIPLLEQGVLTAEEALGRDHLTVAEYLMDLAWANSTAGEWDTAQLLGERAATIFERAHVADPAAKGADGYTAAARFAKNQKFLGDVYSALGEHLRARHLYEKALPITERWGDERELGAFLAPYGSTLKEMGEYEEARRFLERALSNLEKWRGPDNIDVTYTLSLLGNLNYETANYDAARSFLERSLAIRTRALPANHFHLAWVVNDLARVSMAMGDRVRARQLFDRSIAIFEQSGDRGIAYCLTNLGELQTLEGDFDAAEATILPALRTLEQWLGPDHPKVAQPVNVLGRLRRLQGRSEEAVALFARALAIQRNKLAPDHPHLAATLHNLALAYRDLGRIDAAELPARQALDIRGKKLRPEHPDLLESVDFCGSLRWDHP